MNQSPLRISAARAERWWIEQSLDDPYYFTWYVSGRKPPEHVKNWFRAIEEHDHLNIIAPREGMKTTFAVYYIAWKIGREPMSTNMVISVSKTQAEDRLDMVRQIIDNHPRFRNVFPNVAIDFKRTSNKSEFTVKDTSYDYGLYRANVTMNGDPKNPTLYGCGIGSSGIIGRRVSGVLLIDDIHSEANSASRELRQKVFDWVNRTVLPCVKETGRLAVICTRWAEDDYSGRIKDLKRGDGTFVWHTIEIRAFLADGSSYWPEYWPVQKLLDKQDEIGVAAFRLMYMNDPTALSSGQWTADMLRKAIILPLPPKMEWVISCDLAFTTKTASDYCAFGLIGRNIGTPIYDVWIYELYREKHIFRDALMALKTFCGDMLREFPDIKAVLFENQALTIPAFQEYNSLEIPIKAQLVTLSKDKAGRLNSLALKAQRGGLWVNQSMATHSILMSEILGFPRSPHDDTVDVATLPLEHWGVNEIRSGRIDIPLPEVIVI